MVEDDVVLFDVVELGPIIFVHNISFLPLGEGFDAICLFAG